MNGNALFAFVSSPVRNDRNSAGIVDRDSCRGQAENSQHRIE
jgi:hypothetical protein